MQHIEKIKGKVYLIMEDSNDGRFKTRFKLGKDPDIVEKKKPKKTKKEDDK